MASDHLFTIPGSEDAFDDPAAAYEADIEPWADGHDRRPREIEEYTSFTAAKALPAADDVVTWVSETFGDGDYAPNDHGVTCERIESDPEVKAAAEAFLAVVASKITYRWCDELVATHTVTWDADGSPLLDGEPLYRPAGDPR